MKIQNNVSVQFKHSEHGSDHSHISFVELVQQLKQLNSFDTIKTYKFLCLGFLKYLFYSGKLTHFQKMPRYSNFSQFIKFPSAVSNKLNMAY